MNTLIWYSWLGGVIIGTMVGANMVLEEHCRAGPRNVVITGRYSLFLLLLYLLLVFWLQWGLHLSYVNIQLVLLHLIRR